MNSTPTVSAIVVSYNQAADFRLCLEALATCGYPALEIIVVDNASTDGAASVAASIPDIHLVCNHKNIGFAAGVNQGYALTNGDYVALINNDVVVEEHWVQGMVTFLQTHPEAAAVGGKVFFWDQENPLGNRFNHYWSYTTIDPRSGFTGAHNNTPETEREVVTLSGAVVMIRRAVIEDIGPPFLEPLFFTYYEETDFFARAIRKSHRLWYVAEPVAWHRLRASSNNYPYYYHMERNRLLFVFRNFPDDTMRSCLAKTMRTALKQAIRHPFELIIGRDDQLRAQRDAWLWVLFHGAELRRQRKRVAPKNDRRYDDTVTEIESRATYYEHARPEVAALVPIESRIIIDVGCATGALGKLLKSERPGVEVRGIEPNESQAICARAVLDDVLCKSADDPLPESWPRPDCVIFADVLEHLVDPWKTLRLWRYRLSPAGRLIISIPNIGHKSILRGLLGGEWKYTSAGILDCSHLRFFTRKSAINLLQQAGFRVVALDRVQEQGWISKVAQRIEKKLGMRRSPGWLSFAVDLDTIQFLIVAESMP